MAYENFKQSEFRITADDIYDELLNYTKFTKDIARLDDAVYQQVIGELEGQFVTDVEITELKDALKTIPQTSSPGIPYIFKRPARIGHKCSKPNYQI